MAKSSWETIKLHFCDRIDCEVEFKAYVINPAEWMPDSPGRVTAHLCSHAMICNSDERGSCIWAGTNPHVDPLSTPTGT